MTAPRDPSRLLLLLALALCGVVGALAAGVPAAGNDGLLHGHAIGAAAEALRHGWTGFHDPWVPDHAGGFALFRHYPSLGHRVVALLALVTGPWAALQLATGLAIALLPLLAYAGARWMGHEPLPAAVAAFVLATMRCVDGFGHAPLNYSITGGYGAFAQLVGALVLTAAVPLLWRLADAPQGSMRFFNSFAIGFFLASVVLRVHLPSAAVLVVVGASLLVARPRSAGRLVLLAFCGVVMAWGFLDGFLDGLSLVGDETLADSIKTASYGLGRVLLGLLRGDWLDGGRGPWSWAALLAVLWGLRAGGRARWLAGTWVAFVLLFAGRATWGEWMNDLPLLGRFHDQRWQLGFQLLTPWLVAELATAEARAWGTSRWPALEPRLRPLGLALVVAVAGLTVVDIARDARGVGAARAEWARMETALQPKLAALPPGAVLAAAGPGPAGLDALDAASCLGVATVADPRQHYGPLGESMPFWEAWVEGRLDGRPPPTPDDLRAVGASHALLWLPEGPAIQELPPSPTAAPGARLVRSDLALRRDGPALDGATLAWLHLRLGAGHQHPHLVRPGEATDAARQGRLADQDPQLFAGLPSGPPPGRVVRSAPRDDGGIDVELDGADGWLMLTRAWHPGWRVVVDGQPREHRLLFPGYVGVPVDPDDERVELQWSEHPHSGFGYAFFGLAWLPTILGVFASNRLYRRGLREAGATSSSIPS